MSFFTSWLSGGGLTASDPAKRISAIDALAKRGGEGAAAKIGSLLGDPEKQVARAAAEALARLRTPAAQDALSQAVQKALAERNAPAQVGEHELGQDYWLENLADALAAFGPAAAPQLIAMLQNRETELRNRARVNYGSGAARAAEHLGKMFYAGAASALIDRLKDPIESVRWSAASALGEIRAVSAIEQLMAALRDSVEIVRWRVVVALGAIADQRAVAPLEAKLNDGSAMVRDAALKALERLGWKPSGAAQLAAACATRGEYAEAAAHGATALRPIMSAIWNAYWIQDSRSNDAQGMASQLKNAMKKRELNQLPYRANIMGMVAALMTAMDAKGQNFDAKDLKMLALMPDLRVRDFGERTHWSDEIGTHERLEDFICEVSCEALRKKAGALS
jgi:HEAT repeat protein